jgi:AcrR family transcriptional regulator
MPPEGLSPSSYFDAAFEVLSARGPDALKIAALCEQLQVTKGSFYHHFKDLPTFVDGLMAYWAAKHATRLIALSESVTDAEERFEFLQGIAVGLPHDAEAAIRAWSWSNDAVARVMHAVDQARLDHLTRAGIDAGLPAERARLMATISMGVLIGLQQLERPARQETMDKVSGELRSLTLHPAEHI